MEIHCGEVHRGGKGLDGLLTSARRRQSVAAHADGNSLSASKANALPRVSRLRVASKDLALKSYLNPRNYTIIIVS